MLSCRIYPNSCAGYKLPANPGGISNLHALATMISNDTLVKRWWFAPTAKNPKEIHIDLEVASSGRFAALVTGKESGEYGKNIFSSGEVQHLVKAGEHIHYVFPLTIINQGQAKNIEFTLLV